MSNRIKAIFAFVAALSLALSGCSPRASHRMGAVIDNLGGIKANASGLDLNAKPAINAADPTTVQGLATKNYVDRVDTAVDALCAANVTLSGTAQTCDGVALTGAGTMKVLALSQTTTTQDGCYTVQSGAWTQCDRLLTGQTATSRILFVSGGTSNKGTWALGGGVVGTNDLFATNIISGSIVGVVNNLITFAQGLGVTVLAGWQSDLNVTLNSTTVSQWNDQSGNSNHLVQATGGNQPAYTASDATLNNLPTITCTASGSQFMAAGSLDLPAPPITVYAVVRQVSWTAAHEFWQAGGADVYALSPNTSSPGLIMYDGVVANLNNGATVGTWVRAMAIYQSTTADSLKLGSTVTTGTSAGSANPAIGFTLCKSLGGLYADTKIALLMFMSGALSSPNQTALDGAVAAKYNSVPLE